MDRLRSEALNGAMGENCEPIDKLKVDDILEQYKGLNRNEQIYLLLQIGGW